MTKEREEEKRRRDMWLTVQAFDSRVTTIGTFNSGQYDAAGTNNVVPRIAKPFFFFFIGGPGDIAYDNVSPLFFPCQLPHPPQLLPPSSPYA